MNKKLGIYPGSFDPITIGHLDIVDRALKLFDELIIIVASSERKAALLTVKERVELISKILKKNPRVRVEAWDGLTVEYAKKAGATSLVRGLRAASDFEYEFMMAAMNRELSPGLETVFMMTGQNLYFVSSSMIKEIIRFGGDVSPFLPPEVHEHLEEKRKRGELP